MRQVIPAIIITTLLLAGCQAPQRYVPPQVVPGSVAAVSGSDRAGLRGAQTRLMQIDGLPISAGPQLANNNSLVPITLGPHAIDVIVDIRSDGKVMAGFAKLTAQIDKAKVFKARAGEATILTGDCARALVWIEAGDGSLASERVPVTMRPGIRGPSIAVEMLAYSLRGECPK